MSENSKSLSFDLMGIQKCQRNRYPLLFVDQITEAVRQSIEIRMVDDSQQSLLKYLYTDEAGDTSKIKKPIRISMVCRVISTDGDQLTIDRPLRFDVRSAWQPEIHLDQPMVTEVGIENLTIAFPAQKYQGHFTEQGYNAIAFNNVYDCLINSLTAFGLDNLCHWLIYRPQNAV